MYLPSKLDASPFHVTMVKSHEKKSQKCQFEEIDTELLTENKVDFDYCEENIRAISNTFLL